MYFSQNARSRQSPAASHMDQRAITARFPARVLLRPGRTQLNRTPFNSNSSLLISNKFHFPLDKFTRFNFPNMARHIRTVVRTFRIWTGVPDVVYLAGSFKLCIVVFLDVSPLSCVSPLQTCVSLKFTDKNFKQPNYY